MNQTIEPKKPNPLSAHFRTPALYLPLPSGGEYYEDGALERNDENEYPVFAMTANDEIMLKTADALMSGISTAKLIESCVPSIKNGFGIPTTDVDALLISIRMATYGEKMDFSNVCPACQEDNTYEVDLREILEQCQPIDFSRVYPIGDLQFKMRPQLFSTVNKFNIQNFQEARAIEQLSQSNMDEDNKTEELTKYAQAIAHIQVDVTTDFIDHIIVDGTVVDDREHISEFIANCDKKVFNEIEKIINGIRQELAFDPLHVQCRKCGHEYETNLEFESSNFFV